MALIWDEIERKDGQRVRQCDLSGHFWAELSHNASACAWEIRILDYENNVMACAAGLTEAHAMSVVERWDHDIVLADSEPIPISEASSD